MPTTYTPSLRLWQGQPGDPAIKNAWGTTLNTNDNLLEAGILGTATVNIGGLTSYALTTANGAADQARSYVQNYTGALTGNCTVTMPNVPKIGWAINSTTGGRSVILTTGVGTTLSVPNDAGYHWYMVDGAGNVSAPTFTYPALNIASLAVTGNATVGGTLTIAGATNLNGGAVLPNNGFLNGKDTSGASHPMLFYGTDNTTHLVVGTSGHLQIQSANLGLALIDLSAGGILIENNAAFGSYTTTGAAAAMLYFGGDNNVYARAGTGGNFVVTDSTGTNGWMYLTSGGGVLHGSNIVTANGGTWAINITGSAAYATSAGSASSVAWGNISGIPGICYNNGGTYAINVSGSAATANTANYANSAGSANSVAWGNVSGIPNLCYNNGGTYGINITGTSGATNYVDWNNIGNKPGAITSYAVNMNQYVRTIDVVSFSSVNAVSGTGGSAGGWQMNPNGTGSFNGGTNVGFYAGGLDMMAQRFIAASDGRLKTDLEPLTAETAWRFIDAAPVYLYQKRDKHGSFSYEVGVIAQDVLPVLPHVLFESLDPDMPAERYGREGPEGKRYDIQNNVSGLIAMAAIKDLKQTIADLMDEIEGLKRRLKVAGI